MSVTVIKYPNNNNIDVTGTFTPSGLKNGGRVSQVTLSSTNWLPLPSSALANRNAINIQNYSGSDIFLNFDNAVAGFNGVLIRDQSERNYDITDNIIIYAKSQVNGAIIVIEEVS
jgi:hypothetical protein